VPPVGIGRGVFAAGMLVVMSQAAIALLALTGVDDRAATGVAVAALLVVVAALALRAGLELLYLNRRRELAPFGFVAARRVPSSVGIFLGLALVLLPAAVLVSVALGLEGTTGEDLTDDPDAQLVAFAFAVVVVAPWVEEVAMRGMLYSSIAARHGFWPAAAISSLAWSALHVAPGVLLPFAVLGVLLCLLRRRTGSILPGVALHGVWNAQAAAASGAGWLTVAPLALLAATIAAAVLWLRSLRDRPAAAVPGAGGDGHPERHPGLVL
jgi:membrane protease YdiL (CAAX protease family)